MNKLIAMTVAGVAAAVLLTGCLALQVGGGDKQESHKATVGQQLIDLKAAHDAGAITDAEYNAQKAKVLNSK